MQHDHQTKASIIFGTSQDECQIIIPPFIHRIITNGKCTLYKMSIKLRFDHPWDPNIGKVYIKQTGYQDIAFDGSLRIGKCTSDKMGV